VRGSLHRGTCTKRVSGRSLFLPGRTPRSRTDSSVSHPTNRSHRHDDQRFGKRWTLWLACVATFMLILDITVVNVALPDMERTLHTHLSDLEWVVDAYSLALAALLLISGSVGDRIGRRRVFIIGMIVFTGGSLWSSTATSPLLLIAGRAVQGIGAACLFASALALIGHEYRDDDLGRALGVWGATIGVGLAVGPLVGGLLTDLFGWPAIFLVNVPLGVGVVLLSLWRLPESVSPHPKPLDWRGFLAFGLSLFLLVFALVEGNRLGWSNRLIVAAFVGALILGAVWFWTARRRDALFDVRLLADRRFLVATIAVMAQGVVIAAVLLFLLRVLQEAGGASPLVAGAEMLPMTAMAFVAAIVVGRLVERVHPAWLLGASLLLLGTGSSLMLLYGPSRGWLALLPGLIVAGAGWGATNPASAHASLEAVSRDASGMASGFNNTARQVGIAVGVGALGAVFVSRTAAATSSHLSGAPPALAQRLAKAVAQSGLSSVPSDLPGHLGAELPRAASQGMTSAVHSVELIGGLCAVGVALVVFAVGHRDRRSLQANEEEPEPRRRAA
jgi:EmrB/QacA subfamily drug resistance transporter